MTAIPDFARTEFADVALPAATAGAQPWLTPEGIAVKPAYGPDDVAGLDFLDTYPGIAPYLRGPYPTMYVEPAVDDPAICRLLHRRGFERLLPPQPRGRAEGPFGRLRSRHPPRLRLRPSARRRRRRHGGRRDRFDLRHAHAVRRHPARPDDRVDDHERRGAAGAGALHRRGRGAGRAAARSSPARSRTTSSRSSWSATPTSIRPTPSMRIISDIFAYTAAEHAEVQLDLDLRLSHAGGGRDAGPRARLHARRRRRICARRARRRARRRPLRAAALVLLGDRHELLHGGRQAARRAPALGEADEAVRPEGRALAVAAHPLPDLRLVAHRAGRVQQRRCAPRSRRWRRRRGTRSRCTPTRSTRRWRCRPTSRRASPATRSCSCSRRAARRASSIRGAARSTSSG